MKMTQIAAQLYTLRDFTHTASDLAQTLSRVREIGYSAVELCSIPEDSSPQEVRQLADRFGLAIPSVHRPGRSLLEDPGSHIPVLQTLGASYLVYPFPDGIDLSRTHAVLAFIEALRAAGQACSNAGLSLAYHNHHHEFRRLEGRTILDTILDAIHPQHLLMELDVHWVQRGGGDPVLWAQRLNNRIPLIHLKDYRINAKNEPDFAPLGQGNLDFPSIIAAAEDSACQWFIVEQDTCEGDPFDALAQSFRFLSQLIDAEA